MTSIFCHDPALRSDFPTLVAAALVIESVDLLTGLDLDPVPHLTVARARLGLFLLPGERDVAFIAHGASDGQRRSDVVEVKDGERDSESGRDRVAEID